jgi:hydroxymethylbilane synthase
LNPRSPIRIAARATPLAQRHAAWVAQRLTELGRACVLVEIATAGDPSSSGTWRGAGVFVTSVQAAVREGRADLAVCKFEEVPAAPADGLEVAAVPIRAAAHDVLLLRPAAFDPAQERLPVAEGARIGAGAAHRSSQLRALRPDLRVTAVGGEAVTRVAALRAGQEVVEGLVLAAIVLERLNVDLTGLRRVDLDPAVLLPAPGQGALALEIRRGDPLGDLVGRLHDVRGFPAIAAERGLLALLEAGLQPELAAYASRSANGQVLLDAALGGNRVRVRAGSSEDAAMSAYADLRHGWVRKP